MTKQKSDDAMRAADYNIDAAFARLRTAIANPEGLAYIPNGAQIVPVPVPNEILGVPANKNDLKVAASNRELIESLSAQGQKVVTLRVIAAHIARTPDGGLYIGQTYFTPKEATELGEMIQIADKPMPSTIGIEFTSDGHVVALRPFFNGRDAEMVHPLVLEDHPEIPRTNDDPRSYVPPNTFAKLNGVIQPVLATM